MNTRSALLREVGFDSLDAKSTSAAAAQLRGTGLTFAMIYVERATPAIVAGFLQQHIDVCFLSEARTSGWSGDTGAQDGKRAAQRMLSLGVPGNVSLGCDMESGVPSESIATAYGNGWYDAARAEGLGEDAPDLYVGAGSGFVNPAILYRAMHFKRYHRSFSNVPNVDTRGYACIQLYPGNQTIFGVEIDYDVMLNDFMGGAFTLLTL